MISLIEAKNFRCLRYVRQDLERFHVLVGPNASGKTTFLEVVAFLSRLVSDGLEAAIEEQTRNFQDLLWRGEGNGFELAIEATIPDGYRHLLPLKKLERVRYEVSIASDTEGQVTIDAERVVLKPRPAPPSESDGQMEFPIFRQAPETILTRPQPGTRSVVTKHPGKNDTFNPEVLDEKKKRWTLSYALGPHKSALRNLPEDVSKFPVSTWLKGLLTSSVQQFVLNSRMIRKPSAPGQLHGFKSDGSNLPWVVDGLEKENKSCLSDWVAHLRTALPDLENIRTVEQKEDKHRYLMLRYSDGLEIPSWMVSDGTLRLLALTLPAYLPGLGGVFLIEEPENGIHPRAVETMFESLSSVYDAQILLATHSPVILSMVEPCDVLCFAKTPEGATDIVRGDLHPALTDWRHEESLGVLFAGGVLG